MPDSNGFLLPNERNILLRRFAPVLVLFPERQEQAPYPDEGDAIYTVRSSYHPRAVEFFLKHAKVRYRRRVLLRHLGLLLNPRPYIEEVETARQSITQNDLLAAMDEHRDDPRYSGLAEAIFRDAMLIRLVQQRLARRVRGFDLPGFRGHNIKQWQTYFELLGQTDRHAQDSVVYGRLVQGLAPLGRDRTAPEFDVVQASRYGPYDVSQARVALQYWFHYYYDDWANRHEGDWESITVLLEIDPALIQQDRELDEKELLTGVQGRDVGYASHEDGYRRLWEDVQKTGEGRPIVYIARGSSASYFAWRLDGYPTSARVGFVEKLLGGLGSLMRGRRFLGRRWDAEFRARFTGRDPKNTDWTAVDPLPEDRLDGSSSDPAERLVPSSCRGVRRVPDFGSAAGQDERTYHLEVDDLFWLEMVQEYGVQWGENYFLPGARGPGGKSKAERDKERQAINRLALVEAIIEDTLDQIIRPRLLAASAMPELDSALRPLRPRSLKQKGCFPPIVRPYVYAAWAAVLRVHPEAWPGGPGLFLRWRFARLPRQHPLLEREDPIYHVKSLLAQIRRIRYEDQHEGSKWDNPFAWVRYICRADTFYYGMAHVHSLDRLDLNRLDCADVDMSAL